jgi:two-component system, cell cycle sensor histidine kinase and response regulator CckA
VSVNERSTKELIREAEYLRGQVRELQSIIETVPDIIYRLDPDGRIVFINAAVAQYGYTPEEVYGKSIFDLIHPEDRDRARFCACERRTGNRRTINLELRLLAKNNTPVHIEMISRAISPEPAFLLEAEGLYRNNGRREFIGTQGVARDITRRKQAEDRAFRLAAALEHAAEAVIITNTDGIIEYVNDAFEKLTGYTHDEVAGKTPAILRSGRHTPEFYAEMWRCIQAGNTWTGVITNRAKDGAIFTEDATIAPIRCDKGGIIGYVSVKRDITDELRRQQHEIYSQKMEAIAQLAGGIAHDFNNLLQAILGYTEITMLQNPGRKITDNLRQIQASGQRASVLVRRLLAFSRQEMMNATELDFTRFLADHLPVLRKNLPQGIQFDVSAGEGPMMVFFDPYQFEQVLLSLFQNACEALSPENENAPENRAITLHLEQQQLDTLFCEHYPWAAAGEFVILSIADNGRGMTSEVQQHAFEPFYSTKPSSEGGGLGLAMVYGVVKQHEGFIHLYSEPDRGTVVKIYLPALKCRCAPPADGGEAPGGSETILVVEDEQVVRDLMVNVLSEAGYTCLDAEDGRAALELAGANAQKIDFALLDVVLPDTDGRQIAASLREKQPGLPVIFCTGYSEKILGINREGGTFEDCPVIQKPCHPTHLLQQVRMLLDRAAQKKA